MAEKEQEEAHEPSSPAEVFNPCREVSHVAIAAFTNLLRELAKDGSVEMVTVERIAKAVMEKGGPLDIHYDHAFSKCQLFHTELFDRQRRIDMFSRVVVEPFCHLFDEPDSGITRQVLTQFRAAVRMILGDPVIEELTEICNEVAVENGLPLGGDEEWAVYYKDQRTIDVRNRVLIAIAASFKRFDARLEWFLTLMSTDHESISLGSRAFIPHVRDHENPSSFHRRQFYTLFTALYAPVSLDRFDDTRTAEFTRKFDITPIEAFGPFLVEISKLSST